MVRLKQTGQGTITRTWENGVSGLAGSGVILLRA